MRTTRWTFESHDADAARAVRHSFVAYANNTEAGSTPFDTTAAELVIGELVGNVERHAPGSVVVDAEWTSDAIVITVTDDGPCFPLNTDPPDDPLSETGRGLLLVRLCTSSLDVLPAPDGGCQVRAVIAIVPPSAPVLQTAQ